MEQTKDKNKAKAIIVWAIIGVIATFILSWLNSGLTLAEYLPVFADKINEYGDAIMATALSILTAVLGYLGYNTAKDFIKNFSPYILNYLGITKEQAEKLTNESLNIMERNINKLPLDIQQKLFDIEVKYNRDIFNTEELEKVKTLYYGYITELKKDGINYISALKDNNE